ncbi:hypothetical protein GCM10028775_46460 [Catellatospora paridis]
MCGHALLPVSGPLVRSGAGLPHADRLPRRRAYAVAAADYLTWLRETTVLTGHHYARRPAPGAGCGHAGTGPARPSHQH